jgi:hypothetical protein
MSLLKIGESGSGWPFNYGFPDPVDESHICGYLFITSGPATTIEGWNI